PTSPSSFASQSSIDGLDEVVGRPEARRRAVASVVIGRGACGLDLLKGHALLHHFLHAVANDRHHVAVLDDVRFVGDATVPWDHHGAAFLLVAWRCDLDDAIQAGDDAGDGAAARGVDNGIGGVDVDVAGRDYLRLA